MSRYEGIYTFDTDSHKFVPLGNAEGVIDCFEFKHESKEPLIKDEKIRKAVRAWAELNCSHKLHQFNDYQLEDENNYLIEFADSCFTNLKVGKNYTIAELCGEEEEPEDDEGEEDLRAEEY